MSENETEDNKPIILFDGICNLCDNSVHFIINREKENTLLFTSLQSETGKYLAHLYKITEDSIALIEDGNVYTKSTAALKITKYLKGMWGALYPLIYVNRYLRDYIYRIIAKNRYKWFGHKESCGIQDNTIQNKILN